ncbi:PQQ-binding-like beta-propeller repeat protein [Haloferula rosea]|uniref:PQQ-binding-like beta-propeller repeat protein n=1 Tax=Haloferula rosea TaxID=490093 RepID=A0A934VE02_9BACT|nr:PQQ-binding-like beta-propeller repeat protein [Haloferula rosea]MBK1826804.1 PQQ-binding-like beta-propeller repeat protein [Haloferula rosea]
MKISALICLLGAGVVASAHAGDWPRYLGPGGEAKVEGSLGKSFAPKEVWKADIGKGCSGFAIAEGKAVVMGNTGDKDVVWCFDARSGKLEWKYEYAEELNPKFYDGGPSVTPTIDAGRVYTLSRTGNLFCLSLKDGSVKWHKHYQTDFGGKAPSWGFAAAPIVRGDELYCLPCAKDAAVYVLNKATGEVSWKFGKGKTKAGYAAPVFFKYQGKHAVAVFHGRELVTYDLDNNGEPLFNFTWRTSYDVNASNPQFHDGKMFLASGYGMGYVVIDVSGDSPEVLHKEEDTRMIFQNSVRIGDDIVGVFGDKNIDAELIRMELGSGKIHWREKMPGTRGSSLMVGDQMVILAETGDLIAGTPSLKGWQELGRARILQDGKCWAPVAYADGLVFARTNKGEAVCVKVK